MSDNVFVCKYCSKTMTCHNKYTKSGHLAKCKKWKEWKEINLSKEMLTTLYIEEKKSLPEIAEILSLDSVSAIYNCLKKHSIKIRTCSEAFPLYHDKRKETNIERYGAESILFSGHPKRLQFEADLLAKYGVINVFQLESVKEKIKETCLDKYGVDNACKSQQVKDKYSKTLFEKYGVYSSLELIPQQVRYTKPHQKVVELLTELGFNPRIEKYIVLDGKQYFFDIWFDGLMYLIEVNGDFYHANPEKYMDGDWVNPFTKRSATDIWIDDSLKIQRAAQAGFKVLTIWESELKTLTGVNNVKNKLIEFMKS